MEQIFIDIHSLLKRKGWLLFFLIVVFFGLATYSGFKIKTNEDFLALFPQDESFEKYRLALKNSSVSDKIVVFISANDKGSDDKTNILIQQADTFVRKIQANYSPQIADLKYSITDDKVLLFYDFFYENLPIFLTDSDYQKISERISDAAIDTTLKNNFQILVSPAGIALKEFLLRDPLGFTGLALKKLNQSQFDENFTIIQNRIFSKDLNTIFIFITAENSSDTREMENFISRMENIAHADNNSEVKFHCFGSPVIAVANSKQIKKDIYLTLSITLVFTFVFLTICFRNYLIPVLLFIPVIVGVGFSLTIIYFTRGQVSAISLGVGSVLLGIGIDYSLHFLTHYRQAGSIVDLYKSISVPVLMSSITTAAAFLCLFIIPSTVFQDLGFFAAVSIISTALAALIVLPIIFEKLNIFNTKKLNFIFPDNIARYKPEGNKLLVLVVVLLSITFYITGKQTSFNENLLDLNFMTDQLREDEAYLNNKTDFVLSSMFAFSGGETFEQALSESENLSSLLEGMKSDRTIADYFTPNTLIISPQKQKQRIRGWNLFWKDRKDLLISSLIEKGGENKFRPEAFDDFTHLLSKKFTTVPTEKFNTLIDLFFGDYIIRNPENIAVITTIKTDRSQKALVHKKLKAAHGSFLIDNPKITDRLFTLVTSQFKDLILLSSLIVFVILLLAFGRIELAFICYVPIVLSWVWTIGIMGLLNIHFNIFNIIISTFIFGLGVDYSVFITKGLLYKLQYNKDHIVTFKTSILLSGITTIVGTGVLIFARHPAIKSIALVSVIGIASTIFITFTIQPFLFKFLTYYKDKKRALPVNLFNFFFSITSLIYFLFATIFSIMIIIPVIKLLPLKKSTRKLIAHRTIHFFSKTIVYWNLNLSKVLVNITKDTFEKPSLLIANHQSDIDLVLLLMLHPKIVILANKKAWKNPFFGPVIRFADFIYVDEGLDKVAGIVQQRIKQGYSVLIFPEGTRSNDCTIKRFHKGAFYIADKLNMKILPIMLHGACEALNRKEFFLRRGSVQIKVFDEIDLKSGDWGSNYSEYTKSVVQFYRQEFEKLNRIVKVPDRLKHNLINRYIYRGPILEWYLRVKLKLENNYSLINNLVPHTAIITDIGCGYGFLTTMLTLVTDKRKVLGIDYDENKITTARYCTEDLNNLDFVNSDALKVHLPQSDVIILSDVLHYISKEKQRILLIKCFSALNQNGFVIVRDADADLKKRTWGTELTEFFSTNFGFNRTIEKHDFTSGKSILDIAKKFGFETETIDDTKYTSNITYILRK